MIAIVQYNAGNTGSVQNALTRLGYESIITDDTDTICSADKVILPGVGQARAAMQQLQQKGIADIIPTLTQPVLGICLGLQLLCKSSSEGRINCLGIFDCAVKRFPTGQIVPHTGWNTLEEMKGLLFSSIERLKPDVYFVHSYYAQPCSATVAICNYILPFSAALQKDNFYATQFHPEKSSGIGEIILKNFLTL